MLILFGLYIASGLLLVVLSVPLLLGKIPPNPFYGFRVTATLENRKLWYAVNKFAAKRLMAAGFSVVLCAILFYLIPNISLDLYALGCLAVFGVVLGVGLIQSLKYIKTSSK